ncbi:Tigger transposable element-derived protein 1-like [Oopsacas minuta]|uniref:Tigger transposable element-derived protein 1-like n=1 Tax=Oopsacas minuta TaxID=111878 RepID=A0AAV7JT50_9METZ|nr:Tigger transposable element-derived protein 1-like [Oopsacas minuta]KAI6651927.1 Tigger transposable element-derived protein 1-like [Oopsacas minuta]
MPMQSTIISKKRSKLLEEMEKLLGLWMEHQWQRHVGLSLMLIQEKAKSILEDFKAKTGESAEEETFAASMDASADKVAAEKFPVILEDIINASGYAPQQIFNVDKTGLFWKQMPQKTYISREEKTMPGFKAAKDRLTLMLDGNTSGDFKLKPLLVYRAENPRAFKNLTKNSLPVIWKSNTKAWVTLVVFEDWFLNHFIPEVKLYCWKMEIPFKILLLLDNAPGHPPHLDDFYPDVKVVYLPPNTTSLLQPMDQGVIANFKKYYTRRTFSQALKAVEDDHNTTLSDFWKTFNIYMCVKHIDAAWHEVSQTNMSGVWKFLCPQFVNNFQGFNKKRTRKSLKTLLKYFKSLTLTWMKRTSKSCLSHIHRN